MFIVIYKFTVQPGLEERFRAHWRKLTEAIHAKHSSRGSRLHKAHDGGWFAYAQWPSRQGWEKAGREPSADPEAAAGMRACLAAPIESFTGDVSDDLLR